MRKLTATLCLTLAALLGSVGASWSGDAEKLKLLHQGVRAFKVYNQKNYATALREWTPLAKQGDADAQFSLGGMYLQGLGVPQDYKTAVKWYRRVADGYFAKHPRNKRYFGR